MKQIITLILILLFSVGNAQINDHIIRKKVLLKNQIGEEFVFGKWNENGETETHLTYLGEVKTKKGKTYKIMNSTWIWGLSRRATNRMLIFNHKNQYLGEYSSATVNDLPTELDNGILIFRNLENDCDKNVSSKVNLKNGLPKQFFRECRDGYGDIYTFGSN